MSIKTIKLFRTISKIFLILIGVGLVGYLGYLGYISYKFPPYKVTVSNITDSSFTVSWVTDAPTKGYVYYKEKDSFLPGLLGWINSGVAYDDRDWAYNQSVCVSEFNEKAELDENFTVVNSENFDCENIKVKKVGELYTHHVTLKNLDAEKEYYFRVGNGFWMWKMEEYFSKTFSILKEVKEPVPVFGKIVFLEDMVFDDSIVYAQFLNNREEKESIIYSSVTNNWGGWYLDASTVRTSSGDLVEMEKGEDIFYLTGQFLNAELSEPYQWVFGSLDGSYPDIRVDEDTSDQDDELESLNIGSKFIKNIYAQSLSDFSMRMEEDKDFAAKNIKIAGSNESVNAAIKKQREEVEKRRAATLQKGTVGKITIPDKQKIAYVESLPKDLLCPSCRSYVSEEQVKKIAIANIEGNDAYIQSMAGVIGIGNAARIIASTSSGGVIGIEELKTLGLYVENPDGTPNTSMITGNLNALSQGGPNGVGLSEDEVIRLLESGNILGIKLVDGVWTSITVIPPAPTPTGEVGVGEVDEGGGADGGISPEYRRFRLNAVDSSGKKIVVEVDVNNNEFIEKDPSTGEYRVALGKEEEFLTSVSEEGLTRLVAPHMDEEGNISITYFPVVGKDVTRPIKVKIYKNAITGDSPSNISVIQSVLTNAKFDTFKEAKEYIEESGYDLPKYYGTGSNLINIYTVEVKSPESNEKKSLSNILLKDVNADPGNDVLAMNQEELFYYTTEEGIVDVRVDGVDVTKDLDLVGNSFLLLYVEKNGTPGFQAPADLYSPQEGEDTIISSKSVGIQLEKKSQTYKIDLKKGVNIVSFDFMPLSSGETTLTAKALVEKYIDDIQFVANYSSGRWVNIVRGAGIESNGLDFELVPGKGYLISSRNDITLTISGYGLKSSVPFYFSKGWNLVGIHGYTKAFTARSLIDSINGVEGLTADNVSWWPTSKGKYEGLQVTAGTSYGLDFPISPKNGYFVRINKFEPSSSDCNSIIWQEGADAHGKCGTNNL